jgi:hypothetical protein
MTLLERGRSLASSRWTPVVLVALLAAVLVQRLDAGRRAAHEAARLAEAEVLRQKGVAVAAQADARALRAALQGAVARSEDLAAELERVKRASPGARPVAVAHATSGPLQAGGAARPTVPPTSAAACPACLLAAGDRGELRLAQATLQTKGGNLVFVGAAEAWRLEPAPVTRLLAGPLRYEATVEKLAPPPGFGFGVAGSVGGGSAGATGGVAVALPPSRWRRWQLEPTAALEANLAGGWRAGATAVVRRWR